MKRFMFIGPSGSGKTTLIYKLLGKGKKNLKIASTQDIVMVETFIDTPGTYLESGSFHSHLSVCAQQTDYIVLVLPANQKQMPISEGFHNLMIRPILGVVVKVDTKDSDLRLVEKMLRKAGCVGEIMNVSLHINESVEIFQYYLESL